MTAKDTYLIIYEDISLSVVNELDDSDYNSAYDGYITILCITNPENVQELCFSNRPDMFSWVSVNK